MINVHRDVGAEIESLQRETFGYFEHEVNAVNGLVIDKTAQDSRKQPPTSPIALTGFCPVN